MLYFMELTFETRIRTLIDTLPRLWPLSSTRFDVQLDRTIELETTVWDDRTLVMGSFTLLIGSTLISRLGISQ